MNGPAFKTCPFCKEQIRAAAIKCRFCGEWLESKPEQKSAGATESHDEKPVEIQTETVAPGQPSRTVTIGEPSVARESASPPPLQEKDNLKKRLWTLTTPKRLNWASAGLLVFCIVTPALVLGHTNLTANAPEKFGAALGRILIFAGLLAWLSRKGGKGSALFVFSLTCALSVGYFAYSFHASRQTAKVSDRQWAENTLDFYTNALEFVKRGGTSGVPDVKLTGNPINDALSHLMRDLISNLAKTYGRMNGEIDSLGKRDVFSDSVLESKKTLRQEINRRSEALEVLEKYRGAITTIKEECESNLAEPGLTDEERKGLIRGMEGSFQVFSPKYDSLLNARARGEAADREFLQFLIGVFDDYRLKNGKILFGSDTNIAKYKSLSKTVVDAKAELESLVNRFMNEAETSKDKIRTLGGLDSPSK